MATNVKLAMTDQRASNGQFVPVFSLWWIVFYKYLAANVLTSIIEQSLIDREY